MAVLVVSPRLTAGETMAFALKDLIVLGDGSPFPWSDFAIDYSWSGRDGFGGSGRLDQMVGVEVDTTNNIITFRFGQTLAPGSYDHACRFTRVDTGDSTVVFDGVLTVLPSPYGGRWSLPGDYS